MLPNLLMSCLILCLFFFNFAIKLKVANYKSHWNILAFETSEKWILIWRKWKLNMPHGKMPDFVSFSLLGFTLVIKLRNFDFERHWKYFNIFWSKKNNVRFKYVLSNSVWFSLSFIVWAQFWQEVEKYRF